MKKKKNGTQPWYGAKCIFLHKDKGCGPRQMYEERIILVRATSFDKAIKKAEKEAKHYCKALGNCVYTEFVDVFHLFDNKIKKGTEIYSRMRESDLDINEYLDYFYDQPEIGDCELVGKTHRWFNLDHTNSACFHCNVIKEGKL